MGIHRSEDSRASTGVAAKVTVSAGSRSKWRKYPLPPLDVCHYTGERRKLHGAHCNETTVTRQCDLVRVSQESRAAKKEILWSNGPWLGREIVPAWENYYDTQGFPPFAT